MTCGKRWIGIIAVVLFLGLGVACAETFNGETVTPLTLGTEAEAVISEEGGYAYFSYTPAMNGLYALYSSTDENTIGYLYDADGEELTYNDDDDDGEDFNFKVAYPMEEGKTYFFQVGYYSGDTAGTFPVTLEVFTGIFAERIGDYTPSVVYGERTTLAVNALSGQGTLAYQWYVKTEDDEHQPINGATEASYTTEPVTARTQYYCLISDNLGHRRDISYYILVDNDLCADATTDTFLKVSVGDSVNIGVSASCTNGSLTYQWSKYGYVEETGHYDTFEIPGATSPAYTEGGITKDCEYYCDVTDQFENCITITFIVRIDNELRAERVGEYTVYVAVGETATLRVSASCKTGNLTYTWSKSENGRAYTKINGATGDTYVTEPVTKNMYYSCGVQDDYGFAITLSFSVCVSNGLFASPVNRYPLIQEDGSATMQVSASCWEGDLTYQWYTYVYNEQYGYYNSHTITGVNGPTYKVEDAVPGDQYYCVVTDKYNNSFGCLFQLKAENQFTASAVKDEFDIYPGASVTMQIAASCRNGTISYQWSEYVYDDDHNEGMPVQIAGATSAQYTTGNLNEAKEYTCEVKDEYGNIAYIWFSVHIINDLVIENAGDDVTYTTYGGSAELSVTAFSKIGTVSLQWYEEKHDTRSNSTYREIISGAKGNTLTVTNVTQRRDFVCVARDLYNNTDECWMAVSVDDELSVERAVDWIQTVQSGQNATMSVIATTKSGNHTYQWYKGYDNLINGATAASYTVSSVSSSGWYSCRVSDLYGNEWCGIFQVLVPEQAGALTLGTESDAVIDQGGEIALYSFKPSQTGQYTLTTSFSNWGETYIYDQNWDSVSYQEEQGTFGHSVRMIKNVQYYFGVYYYSATQTGTIPLTLTMDQSIETMNLALKVGQQGMLPVVPGCVKINSVVSSNPSVVSVSRTTVTAETAGTATLTVSCETATLIYNVTVYADTGTLRLPGALKTIEEEAFAGDSSVRFVELGSNVTRGEENAFSNSGLLQIVVNNDICWFADSAFSGTSPTIICGNDSSAMYYAIQHGIEYLLFP